MEVFKSVFNPNAKCYNCQTKFKLNRRRKCIICSNPYSEFLFCKKCSIKETHHSLGFLSPKRYCLNCYITACATSTKKPPATSTSLSNRADSSDHPRPPLMKSETLPLSSHPSQPVPLDSPWVPEEIKEDRKSLDLLPSRARVITI